MNNEVLGIIATLVVLVSFLLNNERDIRIVNSIGASLFVIYGILIIAPSVYILNSVLVLIHITKLYKGSVIG